MTFMEELDKALEDGLYIGDLLIAYKVRCLTPLVGEKFEEACRDVMQAWLGDKGGHSISDIVKTTYYLFKKADFDYGLRDILEHIDAGVAWYNSVGQKDVESW